MTKYTMKNHDIYLFKVNVVLFRRDRTQPMIINSVPSLASALAEHEDVNLEKSCCKKFWQWKFRTCLPSNKWNICL